MPPRSGRDERAELVSHQAGSIETDPDRAPTDGRILFGKRVDIGQDFIAA